MLARLLACALLSFAVALPAADLFTAIRNDDVNAVRKLLRSGADVHARNPQGATPLMFAALYASPDCMKLLLDKGADPNASNAFGATALMWAAGDHAKVKLLAGKGANVNAKTNTGRTALMAAVAYHGNLPAVRLLLDKGAELKPNTDRGGAVLESARAGEATILNELLSRGGDPNERTAVGLTALMAAAASGNPETVRLLLAHGADPNAVSAPARMVKAGLQDLGELTALLVAASHGETAMVRALLEKGAKVDARDTRGITPLIFSATVEEQEPDPVRLLLAKSADVRARAKDGQTAITWACKWGADTPIVRLLKEAGAPAEQQNAEPPPQPEGAASARQAVERSIALLQSSNTVYFQKSGCAGCHHQLLSGMLVGLARDRGLRLDEKLAAGQLSAVVAVSNPLRELLLQRVARGGAPMTISLQLLSMAAQKYPADILTDAMVHDIAGSQRSDGSWRSRDHRPPLEYGKFSETAYAIRALDLYAPKSRRKEIDRRIERGREWLAAAEAKHTEERVMQILGLRWAGGHPKIRELAAKLIEEQRADGGWAQRTSFTSDAYATGQVLYTLHEAAGIPVTHAASERGTQFLLKTQYKDGSWYVASRAVKFQPYFESGFPHGHDQWISAAGTAWAAMALALTIEPPALGAQR